VNDEAWELCIGEITAPVGLRGEVRVHALTEHPERFAELRKIGLQRDAGPVRIVSVRFVRGDGYRVVLALDGVDTIDQAEALRGTRIMVPRSWLLPLDEDEYYYDQLLGLEVVTTTGEALGPIIQIWETGANDVYETPLALIPAIKEIVLRVDLAGHCLIVEPRPGLKKSDPGT